MLRAAASIPAVLAVAVAAGLAAAALEFAWYATMSGIPAERVLLSNLNFSYQVRPMRIVMAICALTVPVMLAKPLAPLLPCPAPRRRRPPSHPHSEFDASSNLLFYLTQLEPTPAQRVSST